MGGGEGEMILADSVNKRIVYITSRLLVQNLANGAAVPSSRNVVVGWMGCLS